MVEGRVRLLGAGGALNSKAVLDLVFEFCFWFGCVWGVAGSRSPSPNDLTRVPGTAGTGSDFYVYCYMWVLPMYTLNVGGVFY